VSDAVLADIQAEKLEGSKQILLKNVKNIRIEDFDGVKDVKIKSAVVKNF
jgi:hypothetical protein